MTVEYLGDGNPDGTVFGQSGEKIAFFGGTPAVRGTVTAVATGATIATVVSTLQALQAQLETLGLIADS